MRRILLRLEPLKVLPRLPAAADALAVARRRSSRWATARGR
jgi:hypothetical protein